MLAILKRKYPLKQGTWKDELLLSLIVFFILFLFKPFGLDRYDQLTGMVLPVTLGYGIITFLALTANDKIVRMIQERKGSWTIQDSVIAQFLNWFVIALLNFAYSVIVFQVEKEYLLEAFLSFLYWTFIMSILLTTISILIGYNRHLKSELAQMINKTTEEQEDIRVSIHDDAVRGETLEIPINDFLYAESMKNDLTIWYQENEKTQSMTFRMTMAQLLEQMPYENIFQCHRSFIINVNNITDAKGNSNGYQLKMGMAPAIIPVSRSKVPQLKGYLA